MRVSSIWERIALYTVTFMQDEATSYNANLIETCPIKTLIEDRII